MWKAKAYSVNLSSQTAEITAKELKMAVAQFVRAKSDADNIVKEAIRDMRDVRADREELYVIKNKLKEQDISTASVDKKISSFDSLEKLIVEAIELYKKHK